MGEAVAIEKAPLGDFFGNRRGRRRNRRVSPYRVGEKWLPLRQTASGPQVDYNARLYDPALGRFLSVDPLIAHPGSTQSINPYSYVENNPLNKTDPTGMADCPGGDQASCSAKITNTPTGSHIPQTTTITKGANGKVTTSGAGAMPGGRISTSTSGSSFLQVSTRSGAGQGQGATSFNAGHNNIGRHDFTMAPPAGAGNGQESLGDPQAETFGRDFACGVSGSCSIMDPSVHEGGFAYDFGKAFHDNWRGLAAAAIMIVGLGPEDPFTDAAAADIMAGAEEAAYTLKKGSVVSRVWDSEWTPGSKLSGPFGRSYSPNSSLPINARAGAEDRGLGIPGVRNNAQRGALFRATRDIPATLRTSIRGTEPELLLREGNQQYLQMIDRTLSDIPGG